MKIITVGKNDAGQRLDKFLLKAVRGLPLSLLYKDLRTKKIKLNGKRTTGNALLTEGDEIRLFIKDEFFDAPDESPARLAPSVPSFRLCLKMKI